MGMWMSSLHRGFCRFYSFNFNKILCTRVILFKIGMGYDIWICVFIDICVEVRVRKSAIVDVDENLLMHAFRNSHGIAVEGVRKSAIVAKILLKHARVLLKSGWSLCV